MRSGRRGSTTARRRSRSARGPVHGAAAHLLTQLVTAPLWRDPGDARLVAGLERALRVLDRG